GGALTTSPAGKLVRDFIAPAGGTYYLQVSGPANQAFSLVVTRGASLALSDRYFTDFQSGVGPEWSTNTTDNSVAAFSTFLGRFSNGAATLSVPTAPGKAYTLKFDFYAIDSWDGDTAGVGPDYFNVFVDNAQRFHETFNNVGGPQSFRAPDIGG